jgi:hypothetical protein
MTELTTRRRRRLPSSDAYIDDDPFDENGVLKDGRSIRRSMIMADSAPPPRSSFTPSAPPRFRYGVGYVTDMNSGLIVDARAPRSPFQVAQGSVPTQTAKDLPRGESFPTQSGGTWPSYNNQIGAKCTCENGRAGTLQPHPSTSSMLICVENSKDARAVDSTALYYQLRDEVQDEWRRHGPRQDGCGCHGVKDQGTNIGHINQQLPWSTGQGTGNDCTINGMAGHYERREDGQLVCVPDRNGRDAEIVAPAGTYPVGGLWPEGCACDLGNGEYGVLVKEGNRLVCRARQVGNGDASVSPAAAQARRDAAYAQSVRDAEQAWRNPW